MYGCVVTTLALIDAIKNSGIHYCNAWKTCELNYRVLRRTFIMFSTHYIPVWSTKSRADAKRPQNRRGNGYTRKHKGQIGIRKGHLGVKDRQP